MSGGVAGAEGRRRTKWRELRRIHALVSQGRTAASSIDRVSVETRVSIVSMFPVSDLVTIESVLEENLRRPRARAFEL